jgi:hypothetical protein
VYRSAVRDARCRSLALARVFVAFVLPFALLGTGCGLSLKMVDASVRKPSNVAIYFRVTDHDGKGVPDLPAAQFNIFEDGKPVPAEMSQQTVLADQAVAAKYTLLLLDMSGAIATSSRRSELVAAAAAFADRISRTQEVAICAFDGSPSIRPLMLYAAGGGVVKGDIEALRTFQTADPSDNLNGAVVEAVDALTKQMERSGQPLRLGTLVLFTDGTDHAQRVTRQRALEVLERVREQISVMAVGVGPLVDAEELHALARDGAVLEKRSTDLSHAFAEITHRVDDLSRAHYLLSYCSPARASTHELRIDVDVKHRGAGSLPYHFEADRFQPGCDPNQPPQFKIHHTGFTPVSRR